MSNREFSKISPAVWRSGRFGALDTEAKMLHLYYLSCEHQNSGGCFRLPDGYACSDLGWDVDKYRSCRDRVVNAGLISFDPATFEIYVHRWFKHNPPMNDKHAIGTRRVIDAIESDTIRELVEADFQIADEFRLAKVRKPDGLMLNDAHLLTTPRMQRGAAR